MHIRTTLDSISLHEVNDPDSHPCLYEGDGKNSLEIYFENEENKKACMEMELEDKKVLIGNDTGDYIAVG